MDQREWPACVESVRTDGARECLVTCYARGALPLVPGDVLRARRRPQRGVTIEVRTEGKRWVRAGYSETWPALDAAQEASMRIEVRRCHPYEVPLRLVYVPPRATRQCDMINI